MIFPREFLRKMKNLQIKKIIKKAELFDLKKSEIRRKFYMKHSNIYGIT